MAKTVAQKATFTLDEIAERWGCSHSTVLSHVYGGDLPAIDISTNPKRRSRYIVTAESLQEFEARRTSQPPEPEPVRRRRRVAVPAGGVIEFFS